LNSIRGWVLLPEWLRDRPDFGGVYPGSGTLDREVFRDQRQLVVRLLLWHGGVLLALAGVTWMLQRSVAMFRPRLVSLLQIATLIGLAAATAYAVRDGELHHRGLFVIAGLTGILIGTLRVGLWKRSRLKAETSTLRDTAPVPRRLRRRRGKDILCRVFLGGW